MNPELTRHRLLDKITRFKRQDGVLTPGRQPLRLDNLPDDILIAILSQCHIHDIFALRVTSSTFLNVFSTYSAHIIPSVARCTFPRSKLLLQPPTTPAGYTFTWLKDRIPLQLAAVLVDRHRFVHGNTGWAMFPTGIPAEDFLGSRLRMKVANGWRILGRLSNIANEVCDLDAKEILSMSNKKSAWILSRTSRYEAETTRLREELVLQRRLQFVDSISVQDAQDYLMMFTLLSGAWRVRKPDKSGLKPNPVWPFDFGRGIDAPRTIRLGESWVTWFILREGPRLFWEQWCSLPSEAAGTTDHVCDRAIEAFFAPMRPEDHTKDSGDAFLDPQEESHNMQRECAKKVQQAFHEKSDTVAQILHIKYIGDYVQIRERLGHDPTLEETMGSVPFFVDFSVYGNDMTD
jgi:hypothetical protein